MNELSLHIYDIVQNSVRANAKNVWITVNEAIDKNELAITVKDDGFGMTREMVENVKNPFFTTRTTRRVGLGISLLEMHAEQCNGYLVIDSEENVGTILKVVFEYDHINRNPLGDMAETIYLLSLGDANIIYKHIVNGNTFDYDKSELLGILGDVPLTNLDVKLWIEDYIKENLKSISGNTEK